MKKRAMRRRSYRAMAVAFVANAVKVCVKTIVNQVYTPRAKIDVYTHRGVIGISLVITHTTTVRNLMEEVCKRKPKAMDGWRGFVYCKFAKLHADDVIYKHIGLKEGVIDRVSFFVDTRTGEAVW